MKWTNKFIQEKPIWTIAELAPHAMRVAPTRWNGNVRSCKSQLSQIAKELGCVDINGNKTNFHFSQADAKKIMDETLEWQKAKEAKQKKASELKKKQEENLKIPSVFDMSEDIKGIYDYLAALEDRIMELESKIEDATLEM